MIENPTFEKRIKKIMQSSTRREHEIAHGQLLSESGAEQVWGWGTPAGQIRFHRRANWIIKSAKLRSGSQALEIGCGTGNFSEEFSKSGVSLIALDLSQELLARAKERNLPESVRFLCQPFETLEMPATFDAIIGSSVLHHLEIEPAFVRIFQLLKPGGIMAFGEPNMLNPQIMVQKNIPWIKKRMGDSPDETAFFRWQVKSMLSKIGFVNIEIVPRDWLHPAIPASWIGLFQKVENLLEKTPLVREISGSLYITASRPL